MYVTSFKKNTTAVCLLFCCAEWASRGLAEPRGFPGGVFIKTVLFIMMIICCPLSNRDAGWDGMGWMKWVPKVKTVGQGSEKEPPPTWFDECISQQQVQALGRQKGCALPPELSYQQDGLIKMRGNLRRRREVRRAAKGKMLNRCSIRKEPSWPAWLWESECCYIFQAVVATAAVCSLYSIIVSSSKFDSQQQYYCSSSSSTWGPVILPFRWGSTIHELYDTSTHTHTYIYTIYQTLWLNTSFEGGAPMHVNTFLLRVSSMIEQGKSSCLVRVWELSHNLLFTWHWMFGRGGTKAHRVHSLKPFVFKVSPHYCSRCVDLCLPKVD